MTIVTATYVGNLMAALATEKLVLPFHTLEEFAEQNIYVPGFTAGGLADLVLKVHMRSVTSRQTERSLR